MRDPAKTDTRENPPLRVMEHLCGMVPPSSSQVVQAAPGVVLAPTTPSSRNSGRRQFCAAFLL